MGIRDTRPDALPDGLPEKCYTVLPYSGRLILLKRGARGFFTCSDQSYSPAQNRKKAKAENRLLGVSKAQEAAMVSGSNYGFDRPEADPNNYDKHGVFLQNANEKLPETMPHQDSVPVRPDREKPGEVRER